MTTVRIGYSRLYNARGCSLRGRDEVLLRFTFGTINVEAYVGPNPRHIIAAFKIGPAEPKDATVRGRVSRAREYELPFPETFPTDFYTELVATEAIEVDDALAAAFHGRDEVARAEMLRRAEEREPLLTTALDYVAGVLGLRLHYVLVRTPITEQRYAYRDKGAPYAFSTRLHVKVIATHEWDVSDEGLTATKSRMPTLRRGWTWEKAAEVLAWLLRAWAAEDPVLEFVSLFIPLECVIPKLPMMGKDAWDQRQRAVLAIIEKEAAQDYNELSKFVTALRPPPPPLASRFEKWAADAALPGWKRDIETFRRFNRMRNSLLHAGTAGAKSHVVVEADNVRTLEDIAARYVSLALFGDTNVYQNPEAHVRL
jgi:hypothetical protein